MLSAPVINEFGLLGLLLLLVATIGLLYLPIRLARRMEKRADAAAVQRTADPAVYARALEKFHEINLIPALMPKRAAQVHPDLYDRMLAAGVTPPYKRPNRPRNSSWTTFLLTFLTAVQIVTITSLPEIKKILNFSIESGRPAVVPEPATSGSGSSTNTP